MITNEAVVSGGNERNRCRENFVIQQGRAVGGGGDQWSAAVFVDNLTNNVVLIDPNPQITLQDGAFGRYVINRPLNAGIDVSCHFQ